MENKIIIRGKIPSKSKYNNKKVEICGIVFDSKKEGDRYLVLKDALAKGIIRDLQRQVEFELIPAVREKHIVHLKTKDKEVETTIQRAVTYRADFVYFKGEEQVVEDVKASPKMIPKEYVLKEHMMFAFKGIKIKRVYKATEEI